MRLDWSKLAPNRPLGPRDISYVDRPSSAAPKIVDWLSAGRSSILLAGPVGIGKSTELARAGDLLADSRVVLLIQFDRVENMRTLTTERVLYRIAGELARVALAMVPLAADVRAELVANGVLAPQFGPSGLTWTMRGGADLALSVLREVVRRSSKGRVALLLDGLEKASDETTQRVREALELLRDEADIVFVVPWSVTYGPAADTVLSSDEKLVVVSPLDVTPPTGPGASFLKTVLLRRLDADESELSSAFASDVLPRCIEWSGGVPRTFLQLVADAASYARLSRGETWPNEDDVEQAVSDQRESLRRLLLPGDEAALKAVEGTDGRELDLPRKVRLLSHGMLLERTEDGAPVMRAHPLVRSLLTPVRPHA